MKTGQSYKKGGMKLNSLSEASGLLNQPSDDETFDLMFEQDIF